MNRFSFFFISEYKLIKDFCQLFVERREMLTDQCYLNGK